MTTAKFCNVCGQLILPGATVCPHCGAKFGPVRGSVSPAATSRALPLPAPESLRGACAAVAADGGASGMPEVGRLVAEVTGKPLPDVTREMRVSRGILAMRLTADDARRLVKELRRIGVRAFALGEKDFVPEPRTRRMREAIFERRGVKCEAFTWDRSQSLRVSWRRVFMVLGGRLRLEEVYEVPREKPEQGRRGLWRIGSIKEEFDRRVPVLATRVRYESLLDVILYEPWERLRLDENEAAYGDAEEEGALHAAVRKAADRVYRIRHEAPFNSGIELLATEAPTEAWEDLTFASKQEFDAYSLWLIQLARYGFDIPQ